MQKYYILGKHFNGLWVNGSIFTYVQILAFFKLLKEKNLKNFLPRLKTGNPKGRYNISPLTRRVFDNIKLKKY